MLLACSASLGAAAQEVASVNHAPTEAASVQEETPDPRLALPSVRSLFGTASYYAEKFNGRQTATGAIYDSRKMSAACNRLPLGTWIRVTNLRNKRVVIVQVNDRLHPKNPRLVDMSRIAAERLGYIGRGLTQVRVEVLSKRGG